jgi:hypothetical protein
MIRSKATPICLVPDRRQNNFGLKIYDPPRITGASMSKFSKPPLSGIELPRCPKCHLKMRLARIMPGVPGFEVRSLECPHCEHALVQRVETDPIESTKGWLSSELKPPK